MTRSLTIAVALLCLSAMSRAEEIRVAAAADLLGAFREIAARFEKETGSKVTLIFGSTGLLAKQAEEGAPFDVLAAADDKYIRELESKDHVLPGSARPYALGTLVLWAVPGKHVPPSISGLTDQSYRRIAIANPDHAPYGAAAIQALRKAGILDSVQPKLVYGQNVQQTLKYAESGAADAALISLSLVIHQPGRILRVPRNLYLPIRQGLAVLRTSAHPRLALRFLDVVTGKQGRATLKRYGFDLP